MTKDELLTQVNRFPDPEPKQMILSVIDDKACLDATAAIHKGGRDAWLMLIDLLVDTDPAKDCKARHALHTLVHHACGLGEKERAALAETIASQITGSRAKEIRAFLIHQLRLCAGKESVAALGKVLLDEDLCDPACAALASIGTSASTGAAGPLQAALPQATARQKLAILQTLGYLSDIASVPAFRAALSDKDRDTRIVAGWSLSRIGDAGSVDLLLARAEKSEGWERTQQTKHCLVLAEKLAVADTRDIAARIYKTLAARHSDPKELYIKEAAERGLKAVG
ncbi:MAG: HEAT repeat domain-containing protein [Phycisphaeraceae bacterium]